MNRSLPRRADFFVAGGALRATEPSYVERVADNELFKLAKAGKFVYILTARQMGKTSLMHRVAQRLGKEDIHSARIDLSPRSTDSAEEWYFGILTELQRQLRLDVTLETWWQARNRLGPVQRFTTFLRDVVLHEVHEQVVIFIDEIDTTLRLDFSDDFFASIRAIYNARDVEPIFERLNFVLLGVASPADLIKDNTRTPFNIGEAVVLQDFNPFEAVVLQEGLEQTAPGQEQAVFTRIYYWTDGHPYLTQKLCKKIGETNKQKWSDEQVDKLVNDLFLTESARNENNLKPVHDRIVEHPDHRGLLRSYGRVFRGKRVKSDEQSILQNQLKLSGLIKTEDGYLRVRNRIYQRVFNLAWVRENTKINWAPIVASLAIFIAIVAVSLLSYDYWVSAQINEASARLHEGERGEEQRSRYLARIFKLRLLISQTDFDDKAHDIFYRWSREEQLALFSHHDKAHPSDMLTIIQGLMGTMADVDDTNSNRELMGKMYYALKHINENEYQYSFWQKAMNRIRYYAVGYDETKIIKNLSDEIQFWLNGRDRTREGSLTQALTEYNRAISLNRDNPATLYERAKIFTQNAQYQPALSDLDQVVGIVRRVPTPTPSPYPTTTQTPLISITPTITSTTSPTQESTAFSTLTRSPLPTSTEINRLTPTPRATATSLPDLFISKFVTYREKINAVRELIHNNPDLSSMLAESPDNSYTSLKEARLVPTQTFTPAFTPTSTPDTLIAPSATIHNSGKNFSTLEDTVRTFDEIVKYGAKITVAYSVETGPYSYLDKNGKPQGFEVDMLKEFIERWFQITNDQDIERFVQWIPVRVFDRIDKATEPDIDLVIGAVSYTKERCSEGRWCTTVFHMSDTPALLVPKDENIITFCDEKFNGVPPKTIAVLGNTNTASERRDLPLEFDTCNFSNPPILQAYQTREQAINQVLDVKEIVGYMTEGLILEFYKNHLGYSEQLAVIGESSRLNEYVFLSSQRKAGLTKLIDLTLQEMLEDRTYEILSKHYFNCNVLNISLIQADISDREKYKDRLKNTDKAPLYKNDQRCDR